MVEARTFRTRRPLRIAVQRIVVRDGLAGRAYAVVTSHGLIRFSSLLEHHGELLETLLRRTGLSPL